MTQINLLPWREELKREYLVKFILLAGMFAVVTLIISGLIHYSLARSLSHKSSRIQFLESELKYESDRVDKLNQTLSTFEANELHTKQLIIARNNNFRIIKLIDQIPRLLPKSIALTAISKKGGQIKITGKAFSNSDITLFIKNLAKIDGYSQANLTDITESTSNSQEKRFELYFNELSP